MSECFINRTRGTPTLQFHLETLYIIKFQSFVDFSPVLAVYSTCH